MRNEYKWVHKKRKDKWEKIIFDGHGVLHIGRIDGFKYLGHIQFGDKTYISDKQSLFITVAFTDLNACKNELDDYYRSVLVKEMMKHAGKEVKW